MILAVDGKTDKGLVRQNNEDNFYATEKTGLLLVADGMGGHASGEVASKIAIDVIRDYLDSTGTERPLLLGPLKEEFSETTNRIGSAVRLANRSIYDAAAGNPQWHGMGTTIVAVLLTENLASIAHVGDSRVYLARAGSLQQLTDDHSLVSEQVKHELITKEQARESEMKNVLTRALGVAPEVDVDLDELTLSGDDILILCTDGLSNMVSDEDMLSVVTRFKDPTVACQQLISMANENGGKDNITVVVAYAREKKGWLCSLISFMKWFRR